MSDLDRLDVGMVIDMFVEQANDSYEYPELATADDVAKW